jgi:hypothetical protein
MAFLTIKTWTVAVGCRGLRNRLFERFWGRVTLRPVATGCARSALSEEGPLVKCSFG